MIRSFSVLFLFNRSTQQNVRMESVLGLWITEPVQKEALISPLTGPKTTGNGQRKRVMKLGSMQQYMGPEQLKESFIPKRNH